MTAPLSAKPESRLRIGGLDSLRFVLASWVVLGHFGAPIFPALRLADQGVLLFGRVLIANLFNGPAAVIAFFVISGFCIHYGIAKSPELFLPAYFLRRWIRTLVPMALAIILADLADVKLGLFSFTILWSLLCEEIYYLLYPLLLALRNRFSWTQIAATSFVAAFGVALSQPHALEYPVFGPWLNWLLGLPCWILGCVLAEQVQQGRLRQVSRREIWAWRLAMWGVSTILSVLRFHAGIGYPWTLNLFALLVMGWIAREIAAAKQFGTSPVLETAGGWSYSLYLMHLTFGSFALMAFPHVGEGNISWLLKIGAAFLGSYGFYRLAERPAHSFARRAYHWVGGVRMRDDWRESLTVST